MLRLEGVLSHLVNGHDLYQYDELVHMLANFKEASNQQALEVFKEWRCLASHNVQVFLGKFERRLLELNSHVAWRVLKVKTKVYVYYVAD